MVLSEIAIVIRYLGLRLYISVDAQRRWHPPPFAGGLCDDVVTVVLVRAG
jgi:hypothetical protein